MKVKNQYLKILEYLHLSFNKWPSIQYKFWVSLVIWNHNNGEDCWLGNDPEDEHWHAQTSSGKGLPSHFWTRDNVRSILPGLWRKRTGLLLSGPKSSSQMKVNFAFHLEIKVPESGGRVERHRIHVAWSPVWSFHSQWWFGLPCHLLVLVHCVFWSPQSTQPSTRKF